MEKDEVPTATPQGHTVDPKLLEMLVCPLTRGPLRYDREKQELVSDRGGVAYPIRDGIPIMVPDAARALEPEEGSRQRP